MRQAIPFSKTREKLIADPEFRKEYDALGDEFALIEQAIAARARAGKMQTRLPRLWAFPNPPWRKSRQERSRAWIRSSATPPPWGARYGWSLCRVEAVQAPLGANLRPVLQARAYPTPRLTQKLTTKSDGIHVP